MAALGAAIGLAGLVLLVCLRVKGPLRLRLAGVGALSRVTQVVVGLALIGAGYHVVVHATGTMVHFRAPVGIAIGVAIAAIVGSITIDAIDNRPTSAGDDTSA